MLDAIGPWIGTIGPLPLLFIALVRGWLLTPASMQKVHESQEARITEMKASYEARIVEAREREQEWKTKTAEAMDIVKTQAKQLDVVTELGDMSVKLLEAVHGAKFGQSEEQRAARKTTHVVRPGREG
jgi:Tfp pilus assembly protein PilO